MGRSRPAGPHDSCARNRQPRRQPGYPPRPPYQDASPPKYQLGLSKSCLSLPGPFRLTDSGDNGVTRQRQRPQGAAIANGEVGKGPSDRQRGSIPDGQGDTTGALMKALRLFWPCVSILCGLVPTYLMHRPPRFQEARRHDLLRHGLALSA